MSEHPPVLPPDQAPDHGPDFWPELHDRMTGATAQIRASAAQPTGVDRSEGRRWLVPTAVAAAVAVLAGLGLFALLDGDGPASRELVVAAPTGQAAGGQPETGGAGQAEGPDADIDAVGQTNQASQASQASQTGQAAQAPQTSQTSQASQAAADANLPSASEGTSAASDGTTTGDRSTHDPVARAPGAEADELWWGPTRDGYGLLLLGSRQSEAVSWYAQRNPIECTSPLATDLVFVDHTGAISPVADPPLRINGDLGHLVVSPGEDQVAWLAGCEGRLELHAADIVEAGRLDGHRLVWLGDGGIKASAVTWRGDTIAVSTIGPDGEPRFVAVDLVAETVTGTGVAVPDPADEAAPELHTPFPVGSMPDGSYSWWGGDTDRRAEIDRCGDPETTLWVRDAAGRWAEALVDPVALGPVVTFAVEPTLSQVAFADNCPKPGQAHFYLATVRADGRLSNVRPIDVSTVFFGRVSQLRWMDAVTVRVDIDNGDDEVANHRFDFSFADGRDQGEITVLLD